MGKRSKRRGVKTNITSVPFQAFVSDPLASGAYQYPLAPSGIGGLVGLYQAFELYRFTRLEYYFLPRPNGTTDAVITMAYYPEAVMASGPSVNSNMDNIDCIIQSDQSQVPTPWHHVSRSRLRGQLEWYKCVPDAAEEGFERQGLIQFAGTTTELTYAVVRGVCEFKNPVDTSVAVARMRDVIRAEIVKEITTGVQQATVSPLVGRAISAVK